MASSTLQLPLDYRKEPWRMAAKKQQTHAKRARELAVKERRERKQAKKAAAAALRAAGGVPATDDGSGFPAAEDTEVPEVEWIR